MSQLRAFVERIERLQEEKRSIEDDIKEIYVEIAANGYDKKVVREVVKRRGKDQSELSEFETILQLYEDEIARGTTNASHARDAREGQSRAAKAQEAPSHTASQVRGATGVSPGKGDDDNDGGASPANARVSSAVESSQTSTGITGAMDCEDAGTDAPPQPIAPGRQYTPTPIAAVGEIDLTIPAFLRKGTPENLAIGGAS